MSKNGLIILSLMLISACDNDKQTGEACLGLNNDTLVESIQNECKKGDSVATKNPAYFCDFNYSVAYNDYNTAFCIYSGRIKKERMSSVTAEPVNQ